MQDKTAQEEALRHQMTEKEERTKKAIMGARQKIRQVIGEATQNTHTHTHTHTHTPAHAVTVVFMISMSNTHTHALASIHYTQ